jgi:hypothetical protein
MAYGHFGREDRDFTWDPKNCKELHQPAVPVGERTCLSGEAERTDR